MSDGHELLTPPDHDHGHDHHGHHHHHDRSLAVAEEPLDPASQSLADALRSSFRILKFVMLFVLVLFLFSGVFTVGNNEVAVVTRFGAPVGPPAGPGLQFAWPYPIDAVTRVNTGQRMVQIDAFWLRLSDVDRTKDLSQASYRTGGLDPAQDGALITGDQAIMHLLLRAQYNVSNPIDFVKNVSDEANLVRSAVQQSTVAEAARSTADTVWKEPSALLPGIQKRAQALLDTLQSGIQLDPESGLAVEKSHYPLQVRDDFIAVSDAENRMRSAVQSANKEREDKLKGAAGVAWSAINDEIERLDQTTVDAQRDEIFDRIGKLLTEKATGEAGRKVKLAEGERDRIVAEAHGAADRFLTMLDAYHKNPSLVMEKLRQQMLQQVFGQVGLSRWSLPAGGNKFILLNKNPREIRQAETRSIREKAGLPPQK